MAGADRDRQVWRRDIDFLIVMIGQGVGFGNVWRFPYVCYKNGGGVFLIPYVLAIFLLGIPVCVLEGALGQFTSRGAVLAFKIVPLFQGIGHAIAALALICVAYYSVLFAWVLYYLFSSMNSVLPWSHCNNAWNTPNCRVMPSVINNSDVINATGYQRLPSGRGNVSSLQTMVANVSSLLTDPSTEFWERKVLGVSSGIDEPGVIKWDLALCLLLTWLIIYFCIWKGVSWVGRISYVTATLPYLLILILLIHGLTLDGSLNGVKYYLLPDWSELANGQVWLDACIQVFWSYGVGVSIHTSYGSCNHIHHNILKHYLWFSLINSLTSFVCGFVIFSTLGFMAERQGVSVDKVAESGPGLAFIAYPQAVSQMPIPTLWAILFFLMLTTIAIDSEFGETHTALVAVMDLLPPKYHRSPYKEIVVAFFCSAFFLVGLSMVTEGGVYVQQILEWYCGGKVMYIIVLLECLIVAYCYGASRFQKNLEFMLGYRIGPFLKYLWLFVTPLLCFILFVTDVIFYPDVTYKRKSEVYHFPPWADGLGWGLVAGVLILVPGVMVWRLINTPGSLGQRIRLLMQPEFTKEQEARDRGIRAGEEGKEDGFELTGDDSA